MEWLNHSVVLAGLAVMVIQEILKLKVVPTQIANKYPVPTLIVLSILASVIAVWHGEVANPQIWTSWVQLVATVGVVAALTYNMTIKNWSDLRKMEG